MNKLFYGDNLDILRKYVKDEIVDLCYIDPPFNSKRNYNQIYNNIGKEDRAQAQAFIDTWTWDERAIEGLNEITENYKGLFTKQIIELVIALDKILGKSGLFSYLIHMTLRVTEIYRILKQTGSFYLHCDPTASHYLKLILDAVFCAKGGDFKNEIIWHYRKWAIQQGQYVSNHDVIFFYTKSDDKDRTFNQLFMERAASTLKRFGKLKIISGHDNAGNRLPSQMSDEESEGVALDDVWDIGRVPPIKQLFPTQKPDELLERIITASSKKGDLILDAYCGCGTTIIAAEKLNRKWIGIDITYQSISLIQKRIKEGFGQKVYDNIQMHGVPKDFESAVALANKKDDRVRKEFEKWAVLTYSDNRAIINEKKGGDGGIDGIAYMMDRNKNSENELKQVLFSVKSDKKLPPSYIRDLNGTMEREGAAIGYLISLYPADNLVKESKKYGIYKNILLDKSFPKIQVITVEDILKGGGISIPTTHKIAVTKAAEKIIKSKQTGLDL